MRITRLVGVGLLAGAAAAPLAVSTVAGAASDNGIASKSPQQILSAAVSATRSASSFTLNGVFKSGTTTIGFKNLQLATSGTAGGTITYGGQTLMVREISGNVYLNGSSGFWTKQLNASTAKQVGGKWVYGPASSFGSLASTLNPQSITSSFTSGVPKNATKSRVLTINRQKVVGVTGKTSKGSGTVYVAATGKPYLYRVSAVQGANGGAITFTNYNQPVSVSKPSGAISINSLQHAGSSGSQG